MKELTHEKKQEETAGKVFLAIGIIFVAFNLRPAITAVGPLIGAIRADTGISNALAGLLTTLPVLAFGFLSILAPRIGRMAGNETAIMIGLFILGAGTVLRSADPLVALFGGTLLVGIGIAVINVLLPGIIKQQFPERVGLMTGMYSTAMGIWAALASGFAVPLADGWEIGWRGALAIWAVLAVIALAAWFPQTRRHETDTRVPEVDPANSVLWRSGLAWQVTAFMGLQSFLFYSLIAWLPEILVSRGFSVALAGWMLSWMQLASLPFTFFTPVLADRFSNQRGIVALIGVFYLTGLSILLISGSAGLLMVSVLLIGIAQGSSISLALTLLGLRANNARQAANLSGMAQSVGYLLAASGPVAIGFLFDKTGTWIPAIAVFLVIGGAMIIAGLGAGRNATVPLSKK